MSKMKRSPDFSDIKMISQYIEEKKRDLKNGDFICNVEDKVRFLSIKTDEKSLRKYYKEIIGSGCNYDDFYYSLKDYFA